MCLVVCVHGENVNMYAVQDSRIFAVDPINTCHLLL